MQDRTMRTEEQPAGPPPGNEPDKRQAFTRRKILATLGVTAAGGALAMVNYRDEAQAAVTSRTVTAITEAKAAKHAWCMVIDLRVCDGRKLCTLACQQRHQLREEQTWIRVYEMEHEGQKLSMPVPCMMREDPPCVYVCPVGANLHTDEGLVLVDTHTCIGSRACMAARPYGARYFNWAAPLPPKADARARPTADAGPSEGHRRQVRVLRRSAAERRAPRLRLRMPDGRAVHRRPCH